MSYDCGLFINTGKEEVEIPGTESNYTYNVSPMLRLAIHTEKGINYLDGMEASEAVLYMSSAVEHMETFPELHIAHNPPNGWGSYEGCLNWLRTILSHCEQHPLATLRIT